MSIITTFLREWVLRKFSKYFDNFQCIIQVVFRLSLANFLSGVVPPRTRVTGAILPVSVVLSRPIVDTS